MEFFAIVGMLIAYFNHRNGKPGRAIQRDQDETEPVSSFSEERVLPTDASRLQKLAHWLGLDHA